VNVKLLILGVNDTKMMQTKGITPISYTFSLAEKNAWFRSEKSVPLSKPREHAKQIYAVENVINI